jgi:hypothetical protein
LNSIEIFARFTGVERAEQQFADHCGRQAEGNEGLQQLLDTRFTVEERNGGIGIENCTITSH